jgi:hypothetical protein
MLMSKVEKIKLSNNCQDKILSNFVEIRKFMNRMEEIAKMYENTPSERKLRASTESVSEYFYLLINEKKARRAGFSDYDYRLFKDYCKTIQSHKVMKKILPHEISFIVNINKTYRDTSQFNAIPLSQLRKFQSCLITIQDIYKSPRFSQELTKFIAAEPYSYCPDLFQLIKTKYSVKAVIDFIKLNFARDYFKPSKSDIYDCLKKSKSLSDQWAKVLLEQNSQVEKFVSSLNESNKYKIFLKNYFYGNVNWNAKADNLTSEIRSLFSLILGNQDITAIKKNYDLAIGKENLIRGGLRVIMNKIIIQMFSWHLNFDTTRSHNGNISKLMESEFFSNFAKTILQRLSPTDRDRQESSLHVWTYSIAENALFFIPQLIAERISDDLSLFIDKEIQYFRRAFVKLVTHYNWIGTDYFVTKKDELLSSLDFKKSIIIYINGLIDRLTKFLVINWDKLNRIKVDARNSLLEYKQYIYDNLLTKDGFDHIPKYIDDKTWVRLITNLIISLKRAKNREWKVILPIGNLDCNGQVLKLGNVIVYDSRKWDFGDNYFMDSIAPIKININEQFGSRFQQIIINPGHQKLVRSSARAFIEVIASDEFHAFNHAKEQLLNTLNSMAFVFNDKLEGFRPQFIKYFELIDKQTKRIRSHFERPSIHSYEIFKINDSNLKLLKDTNNFLNRKSNLVVKKRILSSLEWYRRGRWDETENGRFASYWISLEHLIMALGQLKPKIGRTGKKRKPTKKDYLLFYVPKMIAWRNTYANYSISFGYVNNIITRINSDSQFMKVMDNDPKVDQWRNGYVILENLDYIQKISGKSQLGDIILALKDYLKLNKSKIRKHLVIERKQEKFRVAFLYLIRNSMFHDGNLYSEERLAEFNPILENILYNIVFVFMMRNFKSLSQVLRYLNRPINLLK